MIVCRWSLCAFSCPVLRVVCRCLPFLCCLLLDVVRCGLLMVLGGCLLLFVVCCSLSSVCCLFADCVLLFV